MNKLITLAIFFFTVNLYAFPSPNTLSNTCSSIGSLASYMRVACLAEKSSNAYFNQYALGACQRLTDNVSNQIIYPCVIAIKNKTYSNIEIANCDNMADEFSTISCFRNSGSLAGNSSGSIGKVSILEINNIINFSIGAISQYQTQAAIDALTKLKSDLQSMNSLYCH